MTIRQLDPEHVAALSDVDYAAFSQGIMLIYGCSRERDIPADIFALTYRIANKCGARVRCYDDLRRVGSQFHGRRLMIERLRRFR